MVRSCLPSRYRSATKGLPLTPYCFHCAMTSRLSITGKPGGIRKENPYHTSPDERVSARVELGSLRLLQVVAYLLDVTLPHGNSDRLGAGSSVVGRNRNSAGT